MESTVITSQFLAIPGLPILGEREDVAFYPSLCRALVIYGVSVSVQ